MHIRQATHVRRKERLRTIYNTSVSGPVMSTKKERLRRLIQETAEEPETAEEYEDYLDSLVEVGCTTKKLLETADEETLKAAGLPPGLRGFLLAKFSLPGKFGIFGKWLL